MSYLRYHTMRKHILYISSHRAFTDDVSKTQNYKYLFCYKMICTTILYTCLLYHTEMESEIRTESKMTMATRPKLLKTSPLTEMSIFGKRVKIEIIAWQHGLSSDLLKTILFLNQHLFFRRYF